MKRLFICLACFLVLARSSFSQSGDIERTGYNNPAIFASSVSITYGIDPEAVSKLDELYKKEGISPKERYHIIVSLINQYQLQGGDSTGIVEQDDALQEITTDSVFRIISHGNNSPVVFSPDSVRISYGIPEKAFWGLYELLEKKQVGLEEWTQQFAELLSRYENLRTQLAFRSDEMAQEAKRLLDEGELEEAERVLENRYFLTKIKTERARREQAIATWEYVQPMKLFFPIDDQQVGFAVPYSSHPDSSSLFLICPYFLPKIQEQALVTERFAQHVMPTHTDWRCEDTLIADAMQHMSLTYSVLGDYKKAIEFLRLAEGIYGDCGRCKEASLSRLYENIAFTFAMSGQHDSVKFYRSLTLYLDDSHSEKPLPVWESSLTAFHSSDQATLWQLINQANQYALNDEGDKAKIQYLQALSELKQIGWNDTLYQALSAILYHNLGSIHHTIGGQVQVLKYWQDAIQPLNGVISGRHPYTSPTYRNMGLYHQEKNQYSLADEAFQQALIIDISIYQHRQDSLNIQIDHSFIAHDHYLIGRVERLQGNKEKAITHLEQAIEITNRNKAAFSGLAEIAEQELAQCQN